MIPARFYFVTTPAIFIAYLFALAAFSTIPSYASAQPAVQWTAQNPQAEVTSVSIGNNGTHIWHARSRSAIDDSRISLYAATEDGAPPMTVFEVGLPFGSSTERVGAVVDAADKAAFAVAAIGRTGTPHQIRYFSATSSTPLNTFSLPNALCAIEFRDINGDCTQVSIQDDGQAYVVAYTFLPGGMTQVFYRDEDSGSTNSYATGLGSLGEVELSGDGSTVVVGSSSSLGLGIHVSEPATGSLLFSDSLRSDSVAIDGTGDIIGRGRINALELFNRSGQVIFSFDDPQFGAERFVAIALSRDGSTLAASATDFANPGFIRFYMFDVASGTELLRYSNAGTATGASPNQATQISISDDGRWVAMSTTGAVSNSQDEVLLFDRDGGNAPIGSIDTGIQYSADISGDGRFATFGGSSIAFSAPQVDGIGYSVNLSSSVFAGLGFTPFAVVGTPNIGGSFSLDISGIPGDTATLLFSAGLTPTPIPIPGFGGLGTLNVDPATTVSFPLGPIPAGGVLSIPITNFGLPGQEGTRIFMQAVTTGSANILQNTNELFFLP